MKHTSLIHILLLCACTFNLHLLFAAVPLRWTVETSRAVPATFEAYQGETLELEAALQSYGKPLEAPANYALYWQTNGMGSTWWSAPCTNNQQPSTNNFLRATWRPECDVGAKAYTCFIGAPGTIYHAAFQLRLRPSPGATPNELPLPQKTIDFATVEVLNPDAAPWATTNEVELVRMNAATAVRQSSTALDDAAIARDAAAEAHDAATNAADKAQVAFENADSAWLKADEALSTANAAYDLAEAVGPVTARAVNQPAGSSLPDDYRIEIGSGATAMGPAGKDASSAGRNQSIAIGLNATATNWTTIAIGAGGWTNMTDDSGIVTRVTTAATADGREAIAIGYGSAAHGKESLALGKLAKATKDYSLAIGTQATAGQHGIAIGYGADAEQNKVRGIAIGRYAKVDAANSVQLFTGTNTTDNSIQIGNTVVWKSGHPVGETDPVFSGFLEGGKVPAASVAGMDTLAAQVTTIGAHLNAEDARFVVTNYNSLAHTPEAYVEIKLPDQTWSRIWSEITRWNWLTGEYLPASYASKGELAEKADRAWGYYDSSTGAWAPDGYTWISSPRIAIAADLAYQRTITAEGAIWVLESTGAVTETGGMTNGFFRVSDDEGNALFEIVKGDKRTVGADANSCVVVPQTSPTKLRIGYSIVSDARPKLSVCTDLTEQDWKAEDDPDCVASVIWSGASGAYVASVQGKTVRPSLYVKASYEVGGETQIRNSAPVSMTHIMLGGVKYAVGKAEISGHTVLTLTVAP